MVRLAPALFSCSFLVCLLLAGCGPGRFALRVENPVHVEVDSLYVIVGSESLLAPAEKADTARQVIQGAKLQECPAYAQFNSSTETPGTWVETEAKENSHPESIKIQLSKDKREVRVYVHRGLFEAQPKLAAAAVIDYRDGRIASQYFSHEVLENASDLGLRVGEERFVLIAK